MKHLILVLFIFCISTEANEIVNNIKESLFTENEQVYINSNPNITIGMTPTYKPFSYLESTIHKGLSVDILKKISHISGLKIDIQLANFPKNLQDFKDKNINMISEISYTKKRTKFTLFTKPYYEIPNYIMGKKTDNKYKDIATLKEKSIGVYTDIYYKDILLELGFKLKEYDTTVEQFNAITKGEIDYCISPLSTAQMIIKNHVFTNIKFINEFELIQKEDLRFGINKNNHLLHSIIQKSLNQITSKEYQELVNKWIFNVDTKHIKLIQLTNGEKQYIGLFLIIMSLVFIDYVRQQRLKVMIEKEKDKFENIFNNSTDGVLILTNGVFSDCNNSIVNLLGYDLKEDILALTPAQLSPQYQPDGDLSEQKSSDMIQLAIKDGFHNFRWLHLKKDGSKFWCDIMLTNISEHTDEVIHVVWRDISQQVKLEEDLNTLNKTLQEKVITEVEKNKQKDKIIFQKSKQAQMGEMISMIAHQWRQPLASINSIVIGLQLNTVNGKYDLEDKNSLDNYLKEQDTKYKVIVTQVKQLSTTIDDFRNLFNPNKNKEFVDITTPIVKALDIVESDLTNKGIYIKFDTKIDDKVLIYSNEIMQVVLNILKNSEDNFIEKNIQNPQIIINTKREKNNTLTISISDNGGGIPKDIIDKIFIPYFSTKDKEYGTGIGLYMSKMIVEEHNNGKLSVYNTSNGATFNINLKNKEATSI